MPRLQQNRSSQEEVDQVSRRLLDGVHIRRGQSPLGTVPDKTPSTGEIDQIIADEETPFGVPVGQSRGLSPEGTVPDTTTANDGEHLRGGPETNTSAVGSVNPLRAASAAPTPAPTNEYQKPKPPGGPAIQPQPETERGRSPAGSVPDAPEEGEGEGNESSRRGQSPSGTVPQKLQNLLSQQARRQAFNLAKKWLLTQAAAIWAAVTGFILSAGWPVILGIIAVILGGGLFAYYLNYIKTGAPGTTAVQAADPYKDSDIIAKVLALGGDADAMRSLSGNELGELLNYIKQIGEVTSNAETKTKAEGLAAKITTYTTSPTPDLSQQIISEFKELVNHISIQNIPVFAGSTRAPLDNIDRLKPQSPDSLHDGSVLNKNGKRGHNVYLPFTGNGTCDAVDIAGAPKSNVFPVFEGEVTISRDDGWKQGKNWVVVENNGYRAVYAHLKPPENGTWPKPGDNVTTETIIGTIAEKPGHVHFELSYNGRCVVTTAADIVEYRKNPDAKPIGQYLWERMKIILHLS